MEALQKFTEESGRERRLPSSEYALPPSGDSSVVPKEVQVLRLGNYISS